MQEVFEKLVAEFDKRINTQLKIMAGLGDEIYRYGFGKSLEAYHQGKGIIEQTAAEYNNGWIPVESGLPERNKPVLVYAESKTISGGTITMVGACNNGFWFVQSGVDTLGFPCRDYKVIAWQPLPESYQPKGE